MRKAIAIIIALAVMFPVVSSGQIQIRKTEPQTICTTTDRSNLSTHSIIREVTDTSSAYYLSLHQYVRIKLGETIEDAIMSIDALEQFCNEPKNTLADLNTEDFGRLTMKVISVMGSTKKLGNKALWIYKADKDALPNNVVIPSSQLYVGQIRKMKQSLEESK